MKVDELKIKMMNLWKETFHDSENYISLVFDNYFDKSYVEFEEVDGEIISSILAIPYDFVYKNRSLSEDENHNNLFDKNHNNLFDKNNLYLLRGLYLCGLATREEFRGRGIMSKLIKRVVEKAKRMNFNFCFLIPFDNNLRKYYESFGFINGFNRDKLLLKKYDIEQIIEKIYADKNCFKNKSLNNIFVLNFDALDRTFKNYGDLSIDRTFEVSLEGVFKYFNRKELELYGLQIIHGYEDLKNICVENYISGGKIVVSKNNSNEINGLLFVEFTDEKDCCSAVIKNMFCDSSSTGMAMLSFLIEKYAVSEICLYESSIASSPFFSSVQNCPESVVYRGEPYAMVRFLKPSDVLKFQNSFRCGDEFANLANSGHREFEESADDLCGSEMRCISENHSEINDSRKERGVEKLADREEESNFEVLHLGTISLMLD